MRSVLVNKCLRDNKWELINSSFFLTLSIILKILSPESLWIVLFAPALFFLVSLFLFLNRSVRARILEPSTGFILGSGIYFGFGVVAGGMHVHPHSKLIFGHDTSYLLSVNILNSLAVFIVICISIIVRALLLEKISVKSDLKIKKLIPRHLPKLFFIIAILQITNFSNIIFIDSSLVLNSILAKSDYILAAIFLIFGVFWRQVPEIYRIVFLIFLIIDFSYGLMALTKYRALYPLIAWLIGLSAYGVSWRKALFCFVAPGLIFILINPLVTLGRIHYQYRSANSLDFRINDALDVVWEVVNPSGRILTSTNNLVSAVDAQALFSLDGQLGSIGRRFDVASIQGFLMSEYDSGRHGATLSNFWLTFVPRAIWPEKPIITDVAVELHGLYYRDNTQISAAAPTFSGEAYWNYGFLGVAIVSILIGCVVGISDYFCYLALNKGFVQYYIVAFPMFVWGAFVESWLVITYLGQLIVSAAVFFMFFLFFQIFIYMKR